LAWETLWSNYYYPLHELKEADGLTKEPHTATATCSNSSSSPSSPSPPRTSNGADNMPMNNITSEKLDQQKQESSVSMQQQQHHHHQQWQGSLGYGEISTGSILEIFHRIRHHSKNDRNVNDECCADTTAAFQSGDDTSMARTTIVDLGSGNGRVLLAAVMAATVSVSPSSLTEAALLSSTTRYVEPQRSSQRHYRSKTSARSRTRPGTRRIRAMGFEIVESLHQEALSRSRHWQEWDMSICCSSSSCPDNSNKRSEDGNENHHHHHGNNGDKGDPSFWSPLLVPRISLEWNHADFTMKTDWIPAVDIVICHATVFEDALMDKLNVLCRHCRPGTWFVMVTRPLRTTTTTTNSPFTSTNNEHAVQPVVFETVEQLQLSMSWGQATVYLQRRA
jgi:hypothetical protein